MVSLEVHRRTDVGFELVRDGVEADIHKQKREHEFRWIEIKQRIIEWVEGMLLFLICPTALVGLVLIKKSAS